MVRENQGTNKVQINSEQDPVHEAKAVGLINDYLSPDSGQAKEVITLLQPATAGLYQEI